MIKGMSRRSPLHVSVLEILLSVRSVQCTITEMWDCLVLAGIHVLPQRNQRVACVSDICPCAPGSLLLAADLLLFAVLCSLPDLQLVCFVFFLLVPVLSGPIYQAALHHVLICFSPGTGTITSTGCNTNYSVRWMKNGRKGTFQSHTQYTTVTHPSQGSLQ